MNRWECLIEIETPDGSSIFSLDNYSFNTQYVFLHGDSNINTDWIELFGSAESVSNGELMEYCYTVYMTNIEGDKIILRRHEKWKEL